MAELTLSVGGAEDAAFRVLRFSLRERMNEPFSLSIVAGSLHPDLDLDGMILQPASFSLDAGWSFVRDGGARAFTGVCAFVEQLSAEPAGMSLYALRLMPRLGLLGLRRGYRMFQHATIPAILGELLGELDVPAAFHLDEQAFPVLDYKVQYGEADLAFFTRLCEEAGISFSLRDDDQGSLVVLDEAPADAPAREGGPLLFAANPAGTGEREHVTGVRLMREAHPLAVALRDFDFRNPALSLTGRAAEDTDRSSLLEQAHFEPGAFRVVSASSSFTPIADRRGVARHEPPAGARRAEQLLAGERGASSVVSFATNAFDLAPGSVFSIDGHPHPRLGDAARLLVTELSIEGERDKEWHGRGKAVLADRPYRPARRTPRPNVQGLQSAIVTGPEGEELFTDEHGRVRARFLWDREAVGNEESSCWIRVSQGWAGAGYGLWTLPRVGQEVLVGFLEGNPDEPIIVGRAPNAHNPPPYPLPAGATKAVWRSRSTPGAEGYNELSFEDRAGSERFYQRAQKDMETLVGGDESLSVGGRRRHTVKSDEDVSIGGTLRERIGGTMHLTVNGERRDKVGGAHSVHVGGDRQEQLSGRWSAQADGPIHLVSSQAIVIEAPDITLKGAGGFVRVGPGGVTTPAGWVMIQPGAPGSGAGGDPAVPELPGTNASQAPPARQVHLPLLGFAAPGVEGEQAIICGAMCMCKNVRVGKKGKGMNRQNCVARQLWMLDTRGHRSTIKAEAPYDMSTRPPSPIMSRNEPDRPTRGRPAGSKIPDVVIVKDPSKPPTQDNIKRVVEIKFPGDKVDKDQMTAYERIAGDAPVEIWTLEDCNCPDRKRKPFRVPVPVTAPKNVPVPAPVPQRQPPPIPFPPPSPFPPTSSDPVKDLLIILAVIALLLDDTTGAGIADDAAILPLLRELILDLKGAF
ncbi:MAG: type VI secretion system tip protein TssI/VgrG [Minicystis sp.]